MVKSGATTIWEDWEGPTTDNGKGGGVASLNHYSKGAVCEWVFEVMCGIKVDGRNHFVIAPKPGGSFSYAGADYDSVYGKVTCRWKKNADGHFEYDIVVPPNTTASLEINGVEERILNAGIYHFAV